MVRRRFSPQGVDIGHQRWVVMSEPRRHSATAPALSTGVSPDFDCTIPPPLPSTGFHAALFVGSVGILVVGLQPALLGALVNEQRIGDGELGVVVLMETIAIAIGTLLGARMLSRFPGRFVAMASAFAFVVANVAQVNAAGAVMLVALRGVTGLAEGALISAAMVAYARARSVERANGIYLAEQTVLQLLAAAIAPQLTFHGSRADAALLMLVGAGVVAMAAALLLPQDLRPPREDQQGSAMSLPALVALLGAGLFMGAIVAIWSYLGLWLSRNGYDPGVEAVAIPLTLIAEVLGALAAARWGDRLPNAPTVAAGATVQCVLVVLFLTMPHNVLIVYLSSAMFGFVWLFTLPAFAGLLIDIDPTRRAVLYLALAQMCGAAAISALSGVIVGWRGLNSGFAASGTIFALVALAALLASIEPALVRRKSTF